VNGTDLLQANAALLAQMYAMQAAFNAQIATLTSQLNALRPTRDFFSLVDKHYEIVVSERQAGTQDWTYITKAAANSVWRTAFLNGEYTTGRA
jgi:hypothetical protein